MCFAGLHCCELKKNDTCRKVCQETLQSAETQDEMVDRVIAACGYANPSVGCFRLRQHYPASPQVLLIS